MKSAHVRRCFRGLGASYPRASGGRAVRQSAHLFKDHALYMCNKLQFKLATCWLQSHLSPTVLTQ